MRSTYAGDNGIVERAVAVSPLFDLALTTPGAAEPYADRDTSHLRFPPR
jgi:hypothetical protein